MRKIWILYVFCLYSVSLMYSQNSYILENKYLSREFTTDDFLHTTEIVNKQTNIKTRPIESEEFILRFSKGTEKVGTDFILRSKDFKVKKSKRYKLNNGQSGNGLQFVLSNKTNGLVLNVYYELPEDKPYLRKYISIESEKELTLERIDVDVLTLEDVYQPYTKKAITSQAPGNWSPGLGQPVYTMKSGTYWGIEFPAATNMVTEQQMRLGYLWGKQILPGTLYVSYKSVMGTADDPAYIDDAFFDYIDDIRIRPLRLQVQYNSWFDFGQGVNEQNFAESVRHIHRELVTRRAVEPLKAYVIDDGWEDTTLPDLVQPAGVWSINKKFSKDFAETFKLMKEVNSTLGLWLSPGCFFGSRPQVDILRKNGYEALSLSMSMAGPRYMDKLEKRILELTRQGVGYFKYDGLFGHLNIRDFELNGRGTSAMPQLDTEGFAANDPRLNDPKYDELKTYYLVAGTERLMQIMLRQHELNPDVFTAITNGAYLSPWWLQYTDVVWLINCGDAAGGSNRSEELVYWDGVYYEVFQTEHTKFPINSIFNHEPKKNSTGESADEFRDYLFMNLSRGSGFIELYIKTHVLSDSDWDIMAEGLKWVHTYFPAFEHVKMYGGNPREKKIYGYSGWKDDLGYISIHNPSNKPQKLTVTLDRSMGVGKQVTNYKLTSPLPGNTTGLKETWSFGETLNLELQPHEIRLLTFNKE